MKPFADKKKVLKKNGSWAVPAMHSTPLLALCPSCLLNWLWYLEPHAILKPQDNKYKDEKPISNNGKTLAAWWHHQLLNQTAFLQI